MGTRTFYVYILASRIGGTLYIGVTNDLIRRVAEHKSKAAESFTKKYDVDRLVYYECFDGIEQAIHREKRLKKWSRAWKISLIERTIQTGLIFILRLRVDEGAPEFQLKGLWNTGSPGHRRAEATPSFGRLCRAMTAVCDAREVPPSCSGKASTMTAP
jgi:putative endonuclease